MRSSDAIDVLHLAGLELHDLAGSQPQATKQMPAKLRAALQNATAVAAAVPFTAAGTDIQSLLQQLQDDDEPQLQQHAARALGGLAMQGPEQQAAIVAAGAIHPLLVLITHSSSHQLQGYAALALGKLALHNPKTQQAIAGAGAVTPLVSLLAHSSSQEARGCAALAVASLAWHNQRVSAAVAASGVIPHLVDLINSADLAEVHGHAAQALGNLAGAAAPAIAVTGGISCLVQLIASTCSSAAVKDKALAALRNLVAAEDASVQEAIVAAGEKYSIRNNFFCLQWFEGIGGLPWGPSAGQCCAS